MKERIRQLMEAQHMNQKTFSAMTGINSATLSSIFNGRTSPTINQVLAIQKCFPNINLNWILNGIGGMFVPTSSANDNMLGQDAIGGMQTPALSGSNTDNMTDGVLDFGDTSTMQPVQVQASSNASRNNSRQQQPSAMQNVSRQINVVSTPSRRITEIRVFYDDQTWESFVPKR